MNQFPFHKLKAYQHSFEFHRFILDLRKRLPRGLGELSDQIYRASTSNILNLAEGSASWNRGIKLKHFRIAIASQAECQSALDLIGLEVEFERDFLDRGVSHLDDARKFTAGLLKSLG